MTTTTSSSMLDSEAEIVRRGPDGEEVVVAVHDRGDFSASSTS